MARQMQTHAQTDAHPRTGRGTDHSHAETALWQSAKPERTTKLFVAQVASALRKIAISTEFATAGKLVRESSICRE